MLSELLKKSYSFKCGECEISLRYTLAALLSLEEQGLTFSDIFKEKLTGDEILKFFSAGLCEKLPEEYVLKTAEALGYERLWEHCAEAMLEAFPKPEKNVVPRPQSPENEEFSFARLRALICDVMGKSEEFFWSSTLAELIARWHEYAVAMGYAEEPERILEFDVEGM